MSLWCVFLIMLKEEQSVKQDIKHLFRRWFHDEYLDLIIWFEKANQIFGFQLCYNKLDNEHSLTWTVEDGFKHNRIDDGEMTFRIKRTPVLVKDGQVPIQMIIQEFSTRSKNIDKLIVDFVLDKLNQL